MKLKNPFSDSVRNNFLYVYSCFRCGRSDRGLELHHITGRDSSSMINACPLCKDCHNSIRHNFEEETILRELTLRFYLKNEIDIPSDDVLYLYSVDKQLYFKYKYMLNYIGNNL